MLNESATRNPGLCCFDKAVSIVTQPSRSRSTAIDSTAAHWSFLAMPSATPGFTVSRTFLTWCTTVRPYNAQCCAMTAGEALCEPGGGQVISGGQHCEGGGRQEGSLKRAPA